MPSFWSWPLRRPREFARYVAEVAAASSATRGNYAYWLIRWIANGGDPRWALSPAAWRAVRAATHALPDGSRALELGGGLASLLLRSRGFRVTAVESDVEWVERLRRASPSSRPVDVVHAPLVGGWYDAACVPSDPFSLVLVDGPVEDRRGVLLHARPLLGAADVIVLDDMDTPRFRELAHEIAEVLGREIFETGGVAVVVKRAP